MTIFNQHYVEGNQDYGREECIDHYDHINAVIQTIFLFYF